MKAVKILLPFFISCTLVLLCTWIYDLVYFHFYPVKISDVPAEIEYPDQNFPAVSLLLLLISPFLLLIQIFTVTPVWKFMVVKGKKGIKQFLVLALSVSVGLSLLIGAMIVSSMRPILISTWIEVTCWLTLFQLIYWVANSFTLFLLYKPIELVNENN